MHPAPSLGRLSPLNRPSNLAVFSLSSTFRQTMRPRLRSRARQTFDMLPWPVRPISSKRLGMLTRFCWEPPKRLEKKPTVRFSSSLPPRRGRGPNSVLAKVDHPRHLRAKVAAVDDAVDEAVLQQELARLEPVRQLQPHRVPDRPIAGAAH